MKSNLPGSVQDELDAATFRRFLAHLDKNKDVQNIDLMILADFCRNCLSKWYLAEAQARGVSISDEEARERVYGILLVTGFYILRQHCSRIKLL